MVQDILNNFKNNIFQKNDFLTLLEIKSESEFQPVFDYSEQICELVYKKDVYVRGIIEFSNYCERCCFYCGIRKPNKKVKRYRMSNSEILEAVKIAHASNIKTVVLQSGEDNYYTDDILTDLLQQIKRECDMAITLSIGERSRESYKRLKEAGADRFLLRIETTDPKLFKKLHPDDNLENRKQCLYHLRKLGYEVGTGIMVGLPDQSLESIVDDIFFFKELDADMIGIGPFLPHEDTPLGQEQAKEFFLTLKVLALIRILCPEANLPATTAMGTIDPQGRQQALKIGANVIMPNSTPMKYRPLYQLYDNKICIFETPDNCMECTSRIIKQAGKVMVLERGDRKSRRRN